jgi:putative SOS response-associated peptidase YedK
MPIAVTVGGMCGRYATARSSADLSDLFDADDDTGDGLSPDYNVAPTDPVPVVRMSRSADARVLSKVSWGLVPAYAKDTRGGARMINARSETVTRSGAFAPSFAKRRCLVPADGWYEWHKRGPKDKQPYFMTDPAGDVLAFAGLWAVWGRGEERVLTCCVLTAAAVGGLALVHDRMPLLLGADRWADWLTAAPGDAERLLEPPSTELVERLEMRPVSARVGDVRNDGPSLVERVEAPAPTAPEPNRADLTLF